MSRKKQHKVYVCVCVCLRRKTKGLALFIVLRFAYPTSIEVPGLDDCSTAGSVPCLPCDLHRYPYVLSKAPTPHYHSLNSFCSIMSIDGKPFLGAVIVPLAPLSKLCPMHLQARMFHHRSRRAITPLKRTLIPVPQLGTCAAACASANFRLCNGIQAASSLATKQTVQQYRLCSGIHCHLCAREATDLPSFYRTCNTLARCTPVPGTRQTVKHRPRMIKKLLTSCSSVSSSPFL